MTFLNVLTITNLYPNSVQPRHGIFVENRLRRLVKSKGVSLRVIAPIPWRPFERAKAISVLEQRYGIDVYHPRFLAIPLLGMYINPIVMALMIIWCIYKNRQTIGVIDLIDAHFFYPDGVAAAIVASVMSKPFLITARGSDINVFPQFCIPRLLIRWAIKKSAALITVSRALKNKLIELGAHEGHIHVLQNGVDTHLFSVIDNNIKLEHIDKKDSFILSVGNLVEEKGHIYTLRAVAKLPEYKLVLIGEGKQEDVLRREAEQLGISDRVIFIPFLKQADLVHYYNQASVLVLASTREGMPNVVLEALACGTPVVASAVGGVPEIILDKQVGALFTPRAVDEIVRCIKEMPGKSGDSAYIHQYARGFSWENTINQLEQLFNDVKSVDAKSRIKT